MLKSWLAAVFMLLASTSGTAAPAQASVLPELRELAQRDAQAGDDRAKAYLDVQGASVPAKATAERGAQWLVAKAAKGVPAAQFMLGIVLEERQPPEYERARSYIEKAAAQGYVPAMSRLAVFYERGRGGPADPAKAFAWAMKAAQAGDSDAQMFVGGSYLDGKGVAKDSRQAVEWLEKAGAQGDSNAAVVLTLLYAGGNGVPKDEQRMKYWAAKVPAKQTAASASADPQARAARARALERDPAAWPLFNLADRGDVRAQSRIGFLFLEGKSYPQDFEHAAYYLTRAAEAGDARAQLDLGIMHAKGQKFPRDEAEGLKWFRKAADQGNPQAQANVGYCYLKGACGVKADRAEATRWLELAAAQGNKYAKDTLGKMARAR